ncbi:hypothetical protein AB0M02_44760 [Actinoplanes sp. NPDC051861]|uniref:hypothetical protein n=1 Tax=Actinoplanes sp. NPDC051861 TaxID=3155170 RepID=UPI003439582D
MAGLLVLKPGTDWTASGGLFDWTLEFLIDRLSAPEAVAYLREILDNNLGSFWLTELPPDARGQAVAQLRDHLVEAANHELPDGEQKAAVLKHLRELAEMAGRVSGELAEWPKAADC